MLRVATIISLLMIFISCSSPQQTEEFPYPKQMKLVSWEMIADECGVEVTDPQLKTFHFEILDSLSTKDIYYGNEPMPEVIFTLKPEDVVTVYGVAIPSASRDQSIYYLVIKDDKWGWMRENYTQEWADKHYIKTSK